MLDIEALTERSKIKVVKPKIKSYLADLSITSDEVVESVTRRKIEDVIAKAEGCFRSILKTWHYPTHYGLFGATANEKYSPVNDIGDVVNAKLLGKAESIRMQEIVLGLMKEYGLNENISFPDPSMSYNGYEDGIHPQGHGIVIEYRAFPSMRYRGVEFARSRSFGEAKGETISFGWGVSDDLAPVNTFGPIKLFQKEVTPDIRAKIPQ